MFIYVISYNFLRIYSYTEILVKIKFRMFSLKSIIMIKHFFIFISEARVPAILLTKSFAVFKKKLCTLLLFITFLTICKDAIISQFKCHPNN